MIRLLTLAFLVTFHSLRANDTLQVRKLVDSTMRIKFNDPQTAERLAHQAMQLAKKDTFSRYIGSVYSLFGAIYDDQGNFNQSGHYYDTALVYYQKAHFIPGIANIHNNFGLIYRKQGLYSMALPAFMKAMHLADSLKSERIQARVSQNIGMLFNDMGRSNEAIPYLERSVKLYTKLELNTFVGRTLNILAAAFELSQKYSSAEKAYQRALDIARSEQDTANLASTLDNYGGLLSTLGKLKEAENAHRMAFQLVNQVQDSASCVLIMNNLANVLIKENQLPEAIQLAKQVSTICLRINDRPELMRAYRNLADAFEKTGNYKDAATYRSKEALLQQEIFQSDLADRSAQWDALYQTTQKEAELKEIKQLQAIRSLELAVSQEAVSSSRKTIFILSLLLLVGLGATYVRFRRIRLVQQIRLSEERSKQQQEGLRAILIAQEEERKRIGKEMHDSLGQKLSALKIRLQQHENASSESLAILSETLDEARNISHLLMPVTLQRMGLKAALQELCERSFAGTSIEGEFETFALEERLSEEVEIALFRVAQELIANAIKHSGMTKFSLQLYRTKEHVLLVAEDNGKGLELSKSGGMGMRNIQSRIDSISGEIRWETAPEGGLLCTVKVPFNSR